MSLSALLLPLFSLAGFFAATYCEPLRVCYYAAWAVKRENYIVRPTDLDPNLCSHIIIAFARLDDTGSYIEPDKPGDLQMYDHMTSLKQRNPNLKVMLSVGGWEEGSDGFIQTVSSSAAMTKFTNNVIRFLRAHNLDGIDMDWEYPADRGSLPEDKENFAKLLQVMQAGFQQEATGDRKLLLSVAVAAAFNRTRDSYDVRAISRSVDFINLMMYDFHGEWEETVNVHSALYSKTDDLFIDGMVKFWVSEGAARDKIVLGMPFYGRTFNLADPAVNTVGALHTGGNYVPYYTICEMVTAHHLHETILDVERVPYVVFNGTWTGYDNMQSLQEKAEYVHRNGYAGVMVWSIDMDDVTGTCGHGRFPLMHALLAGLKGHGSGIIG